MAAGLTAGSRDAFVAIDRDARVIVWNEAAAGLLGVTAEQAVGRRLDQVMGVAHADLLRRMSDLAVGQAQPPDVHPGRSAGTHQDVTVRRVVPWRDDHGRSAVGVFLAAAEPGASAELPGKMKVLEAVAGVAALAGADLPTLLPGIAAHAVTALSCARAAVYLDDEQGSGTLRLAALSATDLADAGAARRLASAPASVRAVRTMLQRDTPVLLQDTGRTDGLAGLWSAEGGASSILAMPLEVGDRRLGALVAAHCTADRQDFATVDVDVGRALARQASLAIANARLYRAQDDAMGQIKERAVAQRDYVYGITHDLRAPVTAVLGFARTLRQAAGRLSAEEMTEAVTTIERQAVRISRMLDDILDAARAESGADLAPEVDDVVLAEIVEEAMATASGDEAVRIEVTLDPRLVILGDANQLSRVVQNLVRNALEYSPRDSIVRLVGDNLDGWVRLRVIDTGGGIPEGVDAFAKFARGSRGGSGLGLYTVAKILAAHGGSITAAPTPAGGTTMTVLLPPGRPTDG